MALAGVQASTPGHWGRLGKAGRGRVKVGAESLGTYRSPLGTPPHRGCAAWRLGSPGSGAGIPARPCLPPSHVAPACSSVNCQNTTVPTPGLTNVLLETPVWPQAWAVAFLISDALSAVAPLPALSTSFP